MGKKSKRRKNEYREYIHDEDLTRVGLSTDPYVLSSPDANLSLSRLPLQRRVTFLFVL